MLLDGAVGTVGWRDASFDGGEHFNDGHAVDGQAGFGLDDHREPYRRGGQSTGRGRGHVSEVCGSGGEGMPGFEGAEREDYDDGDAGIGAFRFTHWQQKGY